MADKTLEEHQRQCDSRYVAWAWMCAILVTLTLGGVGAGWAAAAKLGTISATMECTADSLLTRQLRNEAEDIKQRGDIDILQARLAKLDSLATWLPRAQRTLDEIHALVKVRK